MKYLIILLSIILLAGCSSIYKSPIIDIRDEPYNLDWSPRQPEKLEKMCLKYLENLKCQR